MPTGSLVLCVGWLVSSVSHVESQICAYWQSSTLCWLAGVQCLTSVFVFVKLTSLL